MAKRRGQCEPGPLKGGIRSPGNNQRLDTPRKGEGLTCAVYIEQTYWWDPGPDLAVDPQERNKITSRQVCPPTPAEDVRFPITLSQPNQPDQTLESLTGAEGIGSVTFTSCRPGEAKLTLWRGTDSTDTVIFTIVPNQRQDISVTLDGQAAEGASINVPPGMGISPLIVATIESPTARIEVESSFDNFATRTALESKGNGRWESKFFIRGALAPGRFELRVYDIDFFGDPRQTTYNFRLLDITPPEIKIIEPREDQSILLPKGEPTVDVLVRGQIRDHGQSGYKDGTLTGRFNNAAIPTITTKPGEMVDFTFEFVLKGAGVGPNRFTLTAKDNADNKINYEHEFNVVSSFRPKTIDELLSPRSYLADLIRFVGSHVRDKDNQSVDTTLLSTTFMPGVAENNFFGRFSDPASVMGEQVVNELLPAVYLLRQRFKGPLSLFSEYLKVAYHTLLVAHGTSYEELLTLPPIGDPARRKLAERLGLTAPSDKADGLDLLKPPATVKTDADFEGWLENVFGLPRISTLMPDIGTIGRKSGLLAKRQDYLNLRWKAEDADPTSAQHPLLDPDLVDPEDLNPKHTAAVSQLAKNRSGLSDLWKQIYEANTLSAALQWFFTADELKILDELDQKEKDGVPIADRLPSLRVTLPGFRRLRFYQKLSRLLSASEKEDLAHLLVEVDKLLGRYSIWARSEQLIDKEQPLWPNSSSSGAFVAGHFKRDFLPWRRSIADRLRFEQLVSARMSTFEALTAADQRAVLDAQRVALPLFRDQFLSNLPFDPDSLTERLLVDVASTGARTITLIDQATVMLQSLINGIRLRRFEGEHPAAGWKLLTQWSSDPKDDPDLRLFDEEWEWMGSYASWRSAKRTYLYPENSLFPELRTKDTKPPFERTEQFDGFWKDLRTLAPAMPSTEWIKKRVSESSMSPWERDLFAPLAIGVMLERAGRYALALDQYRTVYDTSKPVGERTAVSLLKKERDNDQPPYITYDDRWTLNSDPHTNAMRIVEVNQKQRFVFRYPYTRFILSRITRCLALWADAEFAMGTDESRVRALNLYLEAKQILGFPELVDPPPKELDEAYLPNPVFATLRDHVSASLQKLRRGLTHLGTPAGPDLTRSADGVSRLLRPTPYRFRLLVERAKQLVALTQNLETQYLAALEKRDEQDEKVRREAAAAQIAVETVSLRNLQRTEAVDGIALAKAQKQRVQVERDRYSKWIAAGPNSHERAQMQAISDAAVARQVANIADTTLAAAQAVQTTAGLFSIVESGGARAVIAGTMGAAVAARGIAQGFVIDKDTTATLEGIRASQQRQNDEWVFQRDLANQDLLIAQEQIDLAADRKAIAEKEYTIALVQQEQAQDMLKFLSTKFTNVEFYEWMSGVLAEVYAFLLRTATTVARQAEGQIAFERQQAPANMIKTDYWTYVNQAGSSSTAADRRGITASARLLEDLTSLDQYAFDTERRLLNLSHTFSLASLFPVEFDEFRRTGLLSFSTMMRQFDEGFPGHYMRLIKKVRLSLAALIPPSQGIRATLSTPGLSRVVTGDPSFPLLVVRQEPQSVALTSPISSTGVFELDMQSDLLFPFEGMGVDTNWFFELPPAGNLFDYDTLFDVVLTIEYTALNSLELRDRVIKQLPRQFIGERTYSVRRDLPDIWYDLMNQPSGTPQFTLPLARKDFPPGISDLTIKELAVSVRLTDGQPGIYALRPSVTVPRRNPDGSTTPTTIAGSPVPAVLGLVSSRQSGGTIWNTELFEKYGEQSTKAPWRFAFLDQGDSKISEVFKDGKVNDILINFTYSGVKPAWH